MREKWENHESSRDKEGGSGQPVIQRITVFPETSYQPKLTKTPSMRAMENYYNMPTDDVAYDNLSFIPEAEGTRYDEPYTISERMPHDYYNYGSNNSTLNDDISLHMFKNGSTISRDYDYAKFGSMGSRSARTYLSNGSDLDSDKREDLGSTSQLVPRKIKSTCTTWYSHLERLICTISLAAGLGNIYRLPQTVFIRGELPFLVAYVLLSILVGFPLLFLELGLGQLAQEGFIKIWRAVPFFKGVGYVKLLTTFVLVIYYALYIALCLYYTIWLAKGPFPFSECSVVRMKETGYAADGIAGEECLSKTFLESPFTAPRWYGIYIGLLFIIWILLVLFSIRKTYSFIKSLVTLFFPMIVCLISLVVHVAMSDDSSYGLEKLVEESDWSSLASANIWYYAAIQVFFSSHIGFGVFVTSAGAIYSKVNPLGMALTYSIFNLIIGIGSVLLFYCFSNDMPVTLHNTTAIAEVHLLNIIYNSAVENVDEDSRLWLSVAYLLFLFAGLLSMVVLIYTLLKVIEMESKQIVSWWQITFIMGIVGFLIGAVLLLYPHFALVHLLDHYIVGNLILISVIIEAFAFIFFYGRDRIHLDFEFIIGKILSKLWYGFWWVIPFLLLGLYIWALSTLQLTGITTVDPAWLYGIGWAVVVTALVFIFVVGIFTATKQEEYYTFQDKLKAALKPARKWGPVDPILRYNWVQWHSKAKEGERDFTLKRRGTKDYTHSVKKYSNPQGTSYIKTPSELSATSVLPKKNDQNQNNIRLSNGSSTYAEPYYNTASSNYKSPLKVTSLVDSFDPPGLNIYDAERRRSYKTNLNPLSRPKTITDLNVDGSNSEDYGTFRKGPYVINDDVGHVCHRRYSEEATEL